MPHEQVCPSYGLLSPEGSGQGAQATTPHLSMPSAASCSAPGVPGTDLWAAWVEL